MAKKRKSKSGAKRSKTKSKPKKSAARRKKPARAVKKKAARRPKPAAPRTPVRRAPAARAPEPAEEPMFNHDEHLLPHDTDDEIPT